MKEFFQSWKFKVIICIFALVFGIMIYAAVAGDNIIFPRSLIETVTQPFVSAGKAVSDWAEGTIDSLVNAQRYKEENDKLKEMLTKMYGELLDKKKTDEENEKLRSIMGIVEENEDYTLSPPCTVTARRANDIFGSFTIDKGTSDGIKLHDPVFTAVGLVGIVTETAPHYSTVSTILSPDVDISAVTGDKGTVGVIENDAEYAASGCCLMSYIPKDSSIKEGDMVLTSGSSVFPADILIGTVKTVFPDENGLTDHAVIQPSENVFKITTVFVITGFEGQDE